MKAISTYLVFVLLINSTTGQTPCPRNQPVIAYHSELESIFLFGGFCSETKTRLDDLWRFSEVGWDQIENNEGPSARSGHAMVFDRANSTLILFGGKSNDGILLNDVWAWDDSWKLITEDGPSARQSHRLVDTDQGILLFGGSNSEGSLNDTWIFNGNSWAEIKTNNLPSARRQHTLAFDSDRKVTILFGGFDRSDNDKIIFGDTWEFDGKEWIQTANNPELARDHHAMAYSQTSKVTILFGGYNDGYLGDTRFWNGQEWEQIDAQGPSARAGKPGLIEDASSGMLLLFGGGDASNSYLMDFWNFNTESFLWSQE